MIRITGGRLRGRTIESPPRSREVRPTTALIRESVFSQVHQQLQDARFLDLFAGSGIMGLEAISRGARFVLAVEKHVEQMRLIRKNYAKLGIPETQAKVIAYDVQKLLSAPCVEEPFDIIFMDPPYGFSSLQQLVDWSIGHGWLKPEGILLIEHGSREPELEGCTKRLYGDSALSIYSAAS